MTNEVTSRPSVPFRNKTLYVEVDRYSEIDSTRIQLLDEDGTAQYTATVMRPESLPDDVVYIKDHSENRGIAKALIGAKLIEPTGQQYRQGPFEVKQFSFTKKLADAFGIALGFRGELSIETDPVDPVAAPEPPTQEPSRLEELAPDLEVETTDMRIEREASKAIDTLPDDEPVKDEAGWFKSPLADEMPADATAGVPDTLAAADELVGNVRAGETDPDDAA